MNELSAAERELLLAAESHGGYLVLFTAAQLPGGIVGAGDVRFNSDPARAARYRDALQSLVRREYLEVRGDTYPLTGIGYAKARELKAL